MYIEGDCSVETSETFYVYIYNDYAFSDSSNINGHVTVFGDDCQQPTTKKFGMNLFQHAVLKFQRSGPKCSVSAVTAVAKGYPCETFVHDPSSFNPNFLYQVNGDANTGICKVTAT